MLVHEDNEKLVRVGKGTPMGDYMRRFWVPALLSEELPQPDCPPARVTLLGEELVAFRDTQGRVGLVDALCPHRSARMFFGRNEECGLRCLYHGWKFDVTGRCVEMPSEPPESGFKRRVTIKAYPTIERGRIVWAYLGDPARRPVMPGFRWTLLPDAHSFVSKCQWQCNWLQALEGGLDSSHVAFLHSMLNPDEFTMTVADKGNQVYTLRDKSPQFLLQHLDHGIIVGARRKAEADSYYWRFTPWYLPFYIITPGEAGTMVTANAYVPMDDKNSMIFRASWHSDRPITGEELAAYTEGGFLHERMIPGTYRPAANKDNDYLIDREAQRTKTFSGILGILSQDMCVLEGMPIVDRSRENLATSDKAIIATRKRLLSEIDNLARGIEPAAPQSGEQYGVRYCATVDSRDTPFHEVIHGCRRRE